MYGCALKKSLTIRTVLLHFLKLEKGQAHSESKDMTITCSVKLLDVCMYLKWLFCFEVLAGMGINLSDFAIGVCWHHQPLTQTTFCPVESWILFLCDTVSGAAAA